MVSRLLLPALGTKKEIDRVIRNTEDRIVVLRFGQESDAACMALDDLLAKTQIQVSRMAVVYTVAVDDAPVYVDYFEITLIPAVVFFYNGQHIKCDYGTPDHTKWIGCFRNKQDFIDLIEVMYRGAIRGKVMVASPISRENVPKYDLFFQDI